MRLGVEWRARRWRELLNLIDHLPGDSYYAEALANDDELAEWVLDAMPMSGYKVRVSDWSPEREALANIEDQLRALIYVVSATSGASPSRPQPSPRPETAADRVRHQRHVDRQRALLDRIGLN